MNREDLARRLRDPALWGNTAQLLTLCEQAASALTAAPPRTDAPALTDEREQFEREMVEAGCPNTWTFQDDGTGGYHNHATEWAWIGWQRARALRTASKPSEPAQDEALKMARSNIESLQPRFHANYSSREREFYVAGFDDGRDAALAQIDALEKPPASSIPPAVGD